MLETGNTIPTFSLPDQSGENKSFQDLLGSKGLVLYAYPKDNTPGCTVEAQQFTELVGAFEKLGFKVVGISKDSVKSHCNFTDKFKLGFPLLSDPDKTLLEPLGAWGEKKLYGKTSMGIIRSTFVTDAEGKLLKVYKNVKAKGHAEKVLAFVEGL